jgi:hypothetical protein
MTFYNDTGVPALVDDPKLVLAKAISKVGNQIEPYTLAAEYESTTPHFDPELSPSQVLDRSLNRFQKLIWNAFQIFCLDDMEAALVRSREFEQERNAEPVLLGTLFVGLKNDDKNHIAVRFVEKGKKRSVTIVDNKIVTEGKDDQYQYIARQIKSMKWFVAYADPWSQNMITTSEMLEGMRKQEGWNPSSDGVDFS